MPKTVKLIEGTGKEILTRNTNALINAGWRLKDAQQRAKEFMAQFGGTKEDGAADSIGSGSGVSGESQGDNGTKVQDVAEGSGAGAPAETETGSSGESETASAKDDFNEGEPPVQGEAAPAAAQPTQ